MLISREDDVNTIGGCDFWAKIEEVRTLEKKVGDCIQNFKRHVYDNGLKKIVSETNVREINLFFSASAVNLKCVTANCHTKFTIAKKDKFIEIIGFDGKEDPCFSIEDFCGSSEDIKSLLKNLVENWKTNNWVIQVGS